MLSIICLHQQYALYVVHWAACIFYFIARQEGRGSNTWFGGLLPSLVATWPTTVDAYIFSLYWSVTTFATVGYGAHTPIPIAQIVSLTVSFQLHHHVDTTL